MPRHQHLVPAGHPRRHADRVADRAAPGVDRKAAPPPCRAARPAASRTRTRPGCGRGRTAAMPQTLVRNSVRPTISSTTAGTWCCQMPEPRKDRFSLAVVVLLQQRRARCRFSSTSLAQLPAAGRAAASAGARSGSARTAPRSTCAPMAASIACFVASTELAIQGCARASLIDHGDHLAAFVSERRPYSPNPRRLSRRPAGKTGPRTLHTRRIRLDARGCDGPNMTAGPAGEFLRGRATTPAIRRGRPGPPWEESNDASSSPAGRLPD